MRLVLGIATAILLAVGMVTGTSAQNGNADNITICHATGADENNPYVVITIDAAGVFNGHYGEGRGDHQDGDDIIPEFEYDGTTYPAQGDQSILENDCEIPDEEPNGEEPNGEEPNGEEPVDELPDTGVGPAMGDGAGAGALLIGLATVLAAGGFVSRRATTRF